MSNENIIEIVSNNYIIEIDNPQYNLLVDNIVIIDYSYATNKPKINGVILNGNKSASDLNLASAENFYTKTEVDNLISTTLSALYPIGSIYIGVTDSCPMLILISGSSWELVGADRVLQGAGTRGNVGTMLSQSLPTHTHNATTGGISANHQHDRGNMEIAGAFGTGGASDNGINGLSVRYAWGAFAGEGGAERVVELAGNVGWANTGANFYASRNWSGATGWVSSDHTHSLTTGAPSDVTYQTDAHVQPDAYLVNIWRRTA